MPRTRLPHLVLSLLFAISCGDDSAPKPDAQTAADFAITAESSVPDQLASDLPEADQPPPTPDAGMDQAGPDTAPPDGYVPGGIDQCAHAQPVTLVAGKATVSGTTTGLNNEFGSGIDCGYYYTYMEGPQAYYSLNLSAGKLYRFKVTTDFSSYFYLFTAAGQCQEANINDDCGSDGTSGDEMSVYSGTPKELYFTPALGGTYVFAVDSSSSSSSGTYSVEIEELVLATNGTCVSALPINLVGGKATVSGNTRGINDEYSSLKCGGSTALDGPQVYYTLQAAAGSSYKFKFTPAFSAYLYIASLSSGCSDGAIEQYCGSQGSTGALLGSVSSGVTKSLVFSPVVAGSYLIAVDSSNSSDAGSFVLEVEEYTPPSNGSCASAEQVTLVGGKATVSGNTGEVKDEFPALYCGGGSALVGPQLYYKLSLSQDKAYQLTLSPTFIAHLYVFSDAASCGLPGIEDDCSSNGASGTKFSSTGVDATYWFAPLKTGTYYLAVDSSSGSEFGDFTLGIQEISLPTNDTCAAAAPLSFSGGKASVIGTTAGAKDEFASLKCGGSTSLGGPQVYYSFSAKADTRYQITFTPNYSAYVYAFSAAASCAEAGIEADCAGKAGGHWGPTNSMATYSFVPPSAGNYLLAVDGSTASNVGGFTLEVEEIPIPPMPTFTAPVSWDFDSSCPALFATNDWECGPLGAWTAGDCGTTVVNNPSSGHSGSGVWGTRLNDCYSPLGNNEDSCNNLDPDDDSILAFKVALPAGWSTAKLTYWAWDDYYIPYDWAEVRVNGVAVQQFCESGSVPSTATWTERNVDLTTQIGQTVLIAFHFSATDVVQYAGWYLDDISVTGQ